MYIYLFTLDFFGGGIILFKNKGTLEYFEQLKNFKELCKIFITQGYLLQNQKRIKKLYCLHFGTLRVKGLCQNSLLTFLYESRSLIHRYFY